MTYVCSRTTLFLLPYSLSLTLYHLSISSPPLLPCALCLLIVVITVLFHTETRKEPACSCFSIPCHPPPPSCGLFIPTVVVTVHTGTGAGLCRPARQAARNTATTLHAARQRAILTGPGSHGNHADTHVHLIGKTGGCF